MTLSEYVPLWTAAMQGVLAPTTLRVYGSHLHRHILPSPIAALELAAITRVEVRRVVADLRQHAAPTVAQQVLRILSSILGSAADDGLIPTNPAYGAGRRLFTRKPDAPPKHLTDEQFAAIRCAAAETNMKAAVAMFTAGRLGLRPGEVVALERADIDLDGRRVRIDDTYAEGQLRGTTKGRRTRHVDMSLDLAWVLEWWLGVIPGRWLFAGRWPERPMSTRNLLEQFRLAAARAEIELPKHTGPHALRHSFGTALAERGAHPLYIQAAMGHRSFATTQGYVKGAQQRDLSAVDGLAAPVRHGPLRIVVAPLRKRHEASGGD